ncbi:hypothetical protein R6Q57_026276 [Mikania cordata]
MHAFGDQYKATDAVIKGPGQLKFKDIFQEVYETNWKSKLIKAARIWYEYRLIDDMVCPDGKTIEAEAAHGTLARYYRVHQRGGETSTNSIASIFSWTRGLAHCWITTLNHVTEKLEATCIGTLESWRLTKDHSIFMDPSRLSREHYFDTEEFIDAVANELQLKLKGKSSLFNKYMMDGQRIMADQED